MAARGVLTLQRPPALPSGQRPAAGMAPACLPGTLSHHAQPGSLLSLQNRYSPWSHKSHASNLPPIFDPVRDRQLLLQRPFRSRYSHAFAQGPREWGVGSGCRSGEVCQAHSSSSRQCLGNHRPGGPLLQPGLGRGMEGAGGPVRNCSQIPRLGSGLGGKPLTSLWTGRDHPVCLSVCRLWSIIRVGGGY